MDAGDTPGEVQAAIGRLAGVSLPHALQLPQQVALQPQGWLAGRCCAYLDAATDTTWVGWALAPPASSPTAALSQDQVRVSEAAWALTTIACKEGNRLGECRQR